MSTAETPYEKAAAQAVDLGNHLADADQEADLWDLADGLLAGAVQYWLYARQPCGDPQCEDCSPLCTADLRLQELLRMVEEMARSSEYFHAPTDFDAGRA
ncbi:hypothetical protein KBTX_04441 [wastewater metagenome]|uniref:Uncharacterized protein n=2 Tax=unclassified sequences TaxID=12908 RepID=A0A6A7SE99_9ZZZZ|nr:hypothetical protein [Arhodomonas sp. KWT]QEA05143.1 hypothetical protein KBTEX_01462 [uncultured organism]QEA08073.1 hypothetical protein KBTEX_04441 [uncultured organism]